MGLEKQQINFLQNLDEGCIHGKNILSKRDESAIVPFYEAYKKFENQMNKNLDTKITAFIAYKKKAHQLNKDKKGKLIFSAQSKLEPTILEEFLFHLFKKSIAKQKTMSVGSVKAYNNLYFSPKNLTSFGKENAIKINQKDQDFSIYKKVILKDGRKEHSLSVPVVSIECKTYVDKTMLEGSIATAAKIKVGNPHCRFYIVTETYEVSHNVDPSTSRIDNIFVLKKGGRNKRNGEFYKEVFKKIYTEVNQHLKSDWIDIEKNIKNKGSIF